jgi:cysteine desulfurase
MQPIYLDYSATTPVDPRVAAHMAKHLTIDGNFGNPASRSHRYGWQAEEAVETARRQVADTLGADPREIVWTSGATEADNLALKGIASYHADKGKHIITSATEHKAVLDSCAWLETKGFDITYLKPAADGLITAELVANALREDTILVSVMHINNELGTINDVAGIGDLLQNHQAFFHTDAAQSIGKVKFDVNQVKADLVSCCAHKVYGPKGIGALFVRRNPLVLIEPQIHGGGHERGMRSGTLPTHQIVGMGLAFELAVEALAAEQERLKNLRDQFWKQLQSLGAVYLNGHAQKRSPGVLNISFGYVDGEALLTGLRNLAISTGSACTSASVEPSYVLKALGIPDQLALSTVRFSMGRFTTADDVALAARLVIDTVTILRQSSVGWQAAKEAVTKV